MVYLVDLGVVVQGETLADGVGVGLLPVGQRHTAYIRGLGGGGAIPVFHLIETIGVTSFEVGFQPFQRGGPVERGVEHETTVVAAAPVLLRLLGQRHVGTLPLHNLIVRHRREVGGDHSRQTLSGHTIECLLGTHLIGTALCALTVGGLVVHTCGDRHFQVLVDVVVQLEQERIAREVVVGHQTGVEVVGARE